MNTIRRAGSWLAIWLLAAGALAAPAHALPHWRGDARARGLVGTLLGIWLDSNNWKRTWVASDRDGIFYSTDGLSRLKPVSDPLFRALRQQGIDPAVTFFGVHPANFGVIYAFFNLGPRAPGGTAAPGVAYTGPKLLTAEARGEGRFFISLDAGRSWRGIGRAVESAWFSPDCNQLLVAQADGPLLRSVDAGATFYPAGDVGAAVRQRLGPDSLGRAMQVHVPALRVGGDGTMVATWYTLLEGQATPGEVPENQPRIGSLYLGTWGTATSTDAGINWTVQESATPFDGPHALPGSVEGLPFPRMDPYYRMTPEGLQRSLDRGTTWRRLILKPTLGSVRLMAVHAGGTGSYVLTEAGLFRQDPASRLWVPLHRPVELMSQTGAPPVPGVVGPHPEAYGPPQPPPEVRALRDPTGMWVDREDPNHLFFCCGNDGLYEAFVQGDRFTARPLWSGHLADLFQDPVEPRFLYSGGMGDGAIWWSHDKGQSWKPVHDAPPGQVRFAASSRPGVPVFALVFDRSNPTALIGALMSPDHGGSWRAIPNRGPFAVEQPLDVAWCGATAWALGREKWRPRLFRSVGFDPRGAAGLRWRAVPIKPLASFNRQTRLFCDPVYGLIGLGMEPRVASLRHSRKFADAVVASREGTRWRSIASDLPDRGKVIDFAVTRGALYMILGDPNGENQRLWEYR